MNKVLSAAAALYGAYKTDTILIGVSLTSLQIENWLKKSAAPHMSETISMSMKLDELESKVNAMALSHGISNVKRTF